MASIMAFLFYVLLFLSPLVMNTYTSEIFEFNKIILLYLVTILIIASWTTRMITERKFLFKRTLLDVPLLLFLGTQGIATILSIDFRTSLLGYYSRFNGGFVSVLCYAILYWAWVSNMDAKKTRATCYVLLTTAFPVCIYGILQHFGIDKDIWVQDVQNRIFSTLGQPNWLAAWICALAPLSWSLAMNNKQKTINKWLWIGLSALLFITLLFTKSRSGLLAFGIEFVIFWGTIFLINRKNPIPNLLKSFSICILAFAFLIALVGTPWTPSLFKNNFQPTSNTQSVTTSLETGGTESGEIRKIVWQGAIDIWKHYPIFGTGVETFAFSYYQFKPEAHNYTSEWDYLYNKAHNEYLNFLATTGIVGLISYLILIGSLVYLIYNCTNYSNYSKQSPSTNSKNFSHSLDQLGQLEIRSIQIALFAGYISILITNFFGFSVVPVSLLFFLLPAMVVTATYDKQQITNWEKTNSSQKFGIFIVFCLLLIVLSRIARYYSADLLFAKGRFLNKSGDLVAARQNLTDATAKSPNEAIFWDELSLANRMIATTLSEGKQEEKGKPYAKEAIDDAQTALELSPRNINLKRNYASTLTFLAGYDQTYLQQALVQLKEAVVLAPTDPKLQYALAAGYYRLGQLDQAIAEMKKAVDMKKDYKDTHYALALMYEDAKQNDKAKEEFMYILEKIDGNDERVKKELDELTSK